MNRRRVGKASAYFSILIALLVLPMKGHLQSADKIRFAVSFPAELGPSALDGVPAPLLSNQPNCPDKGMSL